MVVKGNTKNPSDGTVLCSVVVATPTYTCDKIVWNYIHTKTQMKACKTSDICIRSVDFINVNFWIVILCYGYARYYHWVKLDEGSLGFCRIVS